MPIHISRTGTVETSSQPQPLDDQPNVGKKEARSISSQPTMTADQDHVTASLRRLRYHLHCLTKGHGANKHAKMLHPNAWLEVIDRKHRYHKRLTWMHRRWMASTSEMHFFSWLDGQEEQKSRVIEAIGKCLHDEVHRVVKALTPNPNANLTLIGP